MALFSYTSFLILAILSVCVLRIANTALFGHLSKIPGPVLNRWTGIPLRLTAFKGHKVHYIQGLHEKYGPYVRIAPTDVSIADPAVVRVIHKMGSGFLKASWYKRLRLRGTMLCLIGTKEHSARRKYFSKAFSQQNLVEWGDILQTKVNETVAEIKASARENSETDILAPFTVMASDIAGELCFGESFKTGDEEKEQLQRRETKQAAVIDSIRTELAPGNSFLRSLPGPLHRYFMRVPLAAKRRSSRGGNRAYFTLQRHELLPASDPQKQVFLSKVLAENETGTGLDDAAIVREAKALIVAGTDTTAITATYLVWAILRHPAVKARLQEEIGTLPAGFSAVEVQKLRYLQLVIQETLRLYGAVSGGLPRTVPAGGRQLGGYFVPEDCVVTTQAFTLHRNPGVFPQPLKFIPERWDAPTEAMKECFMPFGLGARTCIGINLAKMELALIAAIFLHSCPNARIAPTMPEMDMDMEDVFVLWPKGRRCVVVLE